MDAHHCFKYTSWAWDKRAGTVLYISPIIIILSLGWIPPNPAQSCALWGFVSASRFIFISPRSSIPFIMSLFGFLSYMPIISKFFGIFMKIQVLGAKDEQFARPLALHVSHLAQTRKALEAQPYFVSQNDFMKPTWYSMQRLHRSRFLWSIHIYRNPHRWG